MTMKRWAAALLALALLLTGASALAFYAGQEVTVSHCDEYITLRAQPSTKASALDRMPLHATAVVMGDDGGEFVRVAYRSQVGYALRRYLEPVGTSGSSSGGSLSPEERYNVNLFLSNFTEVGFAWREGSFTLDVSPESMLVDFAIDHIWFNQQDKLEWGQWGDNNVRLSDRYIGNVVQKYFGRRPYSLSGTRMDYYNGWYYWEETGGHTSDGFACLYDITSLGGGRYSVSFYAMGAGENWDNIVCRRTLSEADARYDRCGSCSAVIDTGKNGSLSDRSTWRLTRYTFESLW